MTHYIKRGYNCDCVSGPNVGHILFECPIVDTIRKEQWQNVVREMPMGMINSVNTMAMNEKLIYIYTCFNGVAIKEWINIYKAVIEFIQVVSKFNFLISHSSNQTVLVCPCFVTKLACVSVMSVGV